MKTTMFETKIDETESNSVKNEENVDTDQTIETFMEDSLPRATEIAISNKITSVSILKSMTHKRFTLLEKL